MNKEQIDLRGIPLTVYSYNTVILGTGAAGFNAADHLYRYGQKDIAIVTEGILTGTSRNTGSDKQTYYKLSLSGEDQDSIRAMAQVYFDGQCVDGDHALCEAALSVQCFFNLVELGVPFPRDRYGEYVGYKTDHDPSRRATSAGPYTSKLMTECLQRSVESKDIEIYNKRLAIRILKDGGAFRGLLCLNLTDNSYELFNCKNLIFATGGPAGMYENSVYPLGHYGANGLAFEAGVKGKNLTEWQYGIASVRPRWNVSGTYMQVLPQFVSTDRNGEDPREFLFDYIKDKGELLSKVFLKGYQWPFDVRKVMTGSSIIDILVYIEIFEKKRRVFLDFRENPGGGDIDFSILSDEARDYLEKAGACFGKPIERLQHMNMPAYDLYKDHGVDLCTERLEIALCAQHNNGGLNVNEWWQSDLEGFFVAGEAAGTHGVYRPGGSALNAGQVGSLRAAQYISARRTGDPESTEELLDNCGDAISEIIDMGRNAIGPEDEPLEERWQQAMHRMSDVGAAIRDRQKIHEARAAIEKELAAFKDTVKISGESELGRYYRLRETLICQYVYLSAMEDYIEQGGRSRGSALYTDPEGSLPDYPLPELFRFQLDDGSRGSMVQEISCDKDGTHAEWRKVREIPKPDDFFENVWRDYRENGNIY